MVRLCIWLLLRVTMRGSGRRLGGDRALDGTKEQGQERRLLVVGETQATEVGELGAGAALGVAHMQYARYPRKLRSKSRETLRLTSKVWTEKRTSRF